MSLATRCSACGTVFRVVQDQLKVSEGWVRCGRCHDVFNALEGLFDLDREGLPSQWPAAAHDSLADPAGASISGRVPLDTAPPPPVAPAMPPLPAALPAAPSADGGESTVADTVADSPLARSEARDSGADSSTSSTSSFNSESDDTDSRDFADARFNSKLVGDDEPEPDAVAAPAAPTPTPLAHQATPVPAFISDADRQARWRRRDVRLALVMASLALGVALALQGALQFRDVIAARWPSLRVVLIPLCDWAGCRLAPPRQLAAVSVDSSGLTRIDSLDAYQLSVVLHNRAAYAVAQPAIDLSLTDSSGRVIARRVLMPRDFASAGAASLAPLSETPLQLTLSAGSDRISGYLIETFYP